MGNATQRPLQIDREKQRNDFIKNFFTGVKCNEINDIPLINKAFHILLFVIPHDEKIYYNNNHTLSNSSRHTAYCHSVTNNPSKWYRMHTTQFFYLMAFFFNTMQIANEDVIDLNVNCFELNQLMCEKAKNIIAENDDQIKLLQCDLFNEIELDKCTDDIAKTTEQIATTKRELTNTNITKREIVTVNDKLTALYSKLDELNKCKSLFLAKKSTFCNNTTIIKELQIYNDKLRKFISICHCEDYHDEKCTAESIKPSKETVICPADIDCEDVK